MAIIRIKDARKMGGKDLDKKMAELRLELAKERANTAIGASATSPGRIREIRRAIARILTVKNENKEKTANNNRIKPSSQSISENKRSEVKGK